MADSRENRKTGRRRTLFGGVVYDEEAKAWNCSISDISETGARIKSEAKLEIGMFVDLKINKFNDLRRTKVMWKREGFVGLEFLVKIDKAKDGLAEFFKIMESR